MTTATTEQAPANKITVEDAGPARKRVKISIPAKAVDERLATSFNAMQSEAVLPGFRKGRAPRQLIEKRFGSAVRSEARNQLIADAYSKAIEEHKIRPVTDPELDEKSRDAEIVPGKPLEVAIEIEVVPDFEMPNLEGLEVKKPVIEVTDEHVDAELTRQTFRYGNAERIEGPFQMYDRMACDAEVTKEGESEPFFKTHDALVVHPGTENDGAGPVLGLMIEDLAGKLDGRKVKDTLTIETVGPEGHELEHVRGKKLTISLTIRDAERITPATIDELVERFGLGTKENLRAQVRLALEQRRDGEQRAAMREQVYEYLIKSIDFPLPEKLSESQITRTLQRQRVELLYQGLEAEEVESRLAESRAQSESLAKNRLKLLFIMARAAEMYKVDVTAQEINGRIAAMAIQRNERPEALREQMQRSGATTEVALQIREHKTADLIISKAKVSEISAEEWNKMVAAQFEAQKAKSGGSSGKSSKSSSKSGAAKTEAAKDEDEAPKKKSSSKKKS